MSKTRLTPIRRGKLDRFAEQLAQDNDERGAVARDFAQHLRSYGIQLYASFTPGKLDQIARGYAWCTKEQGTRTITRKRCPVIEFHRFKMQSVDGLARVVFEVTRDASQLYASASYYHLATHEHVAKGVNPRSHRRSCGPHCYLWEPRFYDQDYRILPNDEPAIWKLLQREWQAAFGVEARIVPAP